MDMCAISEARQGERKEAVPGAKNEVWDGKATAEYESMEQC